MRRRDFLATAQAVALLGASSLAGPRAVAAPILRGKPLSVEPGGEVAVAIALNEGATVIDFAGPWEVFQDVMMDGPRGHWHPFRLYTVAPTREPIRASAGMRILPDFAVEDAPAPDIVVVPAMRSHPAMLEWLAAVHAGTDVTMSVCTGAFQLGRAGLLKGLVATTHHDYYDDFAREFPDVELQRGLRFVENERVSTAGGLTSGIDLALRVVERYFSRSVAERTAVYMEYTGELWKT